MIILALVSPGAEGVQQPAASADLKLVNDVFARLMAVVKQAQYMPALKNYATPIPIELTPVNQINAVATVKTNSEGYVLADKRTGKIFPVVRIYQGLMNDIIEGDPDRLALVIGHEIAHHLLGHVMGLLTGTRKPILAQLTFGREEELAADKLGMELALAAGYSYAGSRGVWHRFSEMGLNYSSFEGLGASHPSWTDRVARLDKDNAGLWRAMGAFENGALLLAIEQYASAEQCFEKVTKEFPKAWDAWSNLGYARLMRYCDALNEEDIRKFEVGQIVVGGFYKRPRSLQPPARGIDRELWEKAVGALRESLRIQKESGSQDPMTLTHATLGIAHLVSPQGKNVAAATPHFEAALAAAEKDRSLDPVSRAAVFINAAVAGVRGDTNAALLLTKARALAEKNAVIASAVSYNRGLVLARSGTAVDKKNAVAEMENFLKTASRASAWWRLGYENYSRLAAEQGLAPKPGEAFAASGVIVRPITSVSFKGVLVSLNEAMADVRGKLGEVAPVAVYPEANLVRLRYAAQGADLVGTDNLIAIFLTDAASPSLELRAAGPAAPSARLSVGMPELQLKRLIGDTNHVMPLVEQNKNYHFYPQLGLALRFAEGKVIEMAVVPIPLG